MYNLSRTILSILPPHEKSMWMQSLRQWNYKLWWWVHLLEIWRLMSYSVSNIQKEMIPLKKLAWLWRKVQMTLVMINTTFPISLKYFKEWWEEEVFNTKETKIRVSEEMICATNMEIPIIIYKIILKIMEISVIISKIIPFIRWAATS